MATHTQVEVELEPLERGVLTAKAPALDVYPSSSGRALGSSSSDLSAPPTPAPEPATVASAPKVSTSKAWVIIIQLCGNNFINSFAAGLLMVCLPTMAVDLKLDPSLILWPNSVTSLAAGSCLLIAGSVADVLGAKKINTPGSFLQSVWIIATGLSRNGWELIFFRTLQGVANSLFVPSAISILSRNIEHGRVRNIGFASMFLAFPLGAGLGLVLGGLYIEAANWRLGYYTSGAVGLALSVLSTWTLPEDTKHASVAEAKRRLAIEIDWVGVVMACASMAMLSYVLAMLSADVRNISNGGNITILTISLALLPCCAVWMSYREKHNKPALIPNSLWKNTKFASVCVMIALINAAQSGMSLYCSLFFQELQHLSPTQTSLRLLPQAVTGALCCIFAGVFINRVSAFVAVLTSMLICSAAPLLMAITALKWPYWYSVFWAQLISPLTIDVMFVVGALVVSDAFAGSAQARGSAVFSTFAQIGVSVGLCIMAVVQARVGEDATAAGESEQQVLLKGYRAAFWTQFAMILASCGIGAIGLRKLGRVGMKRD